MNSTRASLRGLIAERYDHMAYYSNGDTRPTIIRADEKALAEFLADTPAMTSPFYLLLRAHDRLWSNGRYDLATRRAGCHLLWRLAISAPVAQLPEGIRS